MMTPEVVPGGFLDDAQWRTLQNYAGQLASTLNQLIVYTGGLPTSIPPAPPRWQGLTVIYVAVGIYGLAPDDSMVFLNLGGSSATPGQPNYLEISLPLRTDAIGPFYIYGGDDTIYLVKCRGADRIVLCDIINGTPVTYQSQVSCGDATSFVCTVFSPVKDSATDWVRGSWTIRDPKLA